MKKALATLSVLTLVAAATASSSLDFGIVSSQTILGTDYNVWQLSITTTSDDWTAANMQASLSSGSLYEDGLGTDLAPSPAFIAVFPDLAYDSFLTNPTSYPNAASGPSGGLAIAGGTFPSDVDWFDTTNSPDGTYVIAQLTATTDAVGTLSGAYTQRSTGGTLIPYSFAIPEPATLSLLAIGGLALIRRR